MLNKKLIMLAILIVGLLAVSAVSANENITEEVSITDNDNDEIIMENSDNHIINAVNNSKNSELSDVDDYYDDYDDYDDYGGDYYDDYDDYDDYGDDYYDDYDDYDDYDEEDDGDITPIVYVEKTYYKYNEGRVICYASNDFKGYLNIYKKNKIVHKQYLSQSKAYLDFDDYNEYLYSTKKLSIGSYSVKVTDTYGNVIVKDSFKVSKMPTNIKCSSISTKPGASKYVKAVVYNKFKDAYATGHVKFKINGKTYKVKIKKGVAKLKIKAPSKAKTYTCKVSFLQNSKFKSSSKTFKITVKKPVVVKKKTSPYKIITTSAKMYDIYKKSGKFTVKTRIYDMTAGYRKPYKCIDVFLSKNGKLVKNSKYKVNYKINGKWTGWSDYGTIETSHHRHYVYDSASVGQIKVKVKKNENSILPYGI